MVVVHRFSGGQTPTEILRFMRLLGQTKTQNESKTMFEIMEMRNGGNNTVLHEAVRNGHYKVVDFLLEVEPKLACVENNEGESPFYLASREGMAEIVVQILFATPSAAHVGSEGLTALHAAVIERHYGNSTHTSIN
ncbi:Transmembrane protein [Parasponia andersonii]|uniref:Transmembrane protein n=1 Tax=Parasponia andersonii TaxID=3476 RepID=A0A2P5CKE5_PARAD|nr:Transmembrane protein [Parasponia andersonii]